VYTQAECPPAACAVTVAPATSERTVDVHVTRLRMKLRDAEASVRIATVRGVGYKAEAVA